MHKQVNLLQLFLEIDEPSRRIARRFIGTNKPNDFTRDDDGLDQCDIWM